MILHGDAAIFKWDCKTPLLAMFWKEEKGEDVIFE